MLSIIIFSKDRALQLDSLIRSVRDKIVNTDYELYVLRKFTSDEFKKAYLELENRNYLKISWINETRFKDDVIKLINSLNADNHVMFLVDDIIFFKDINISNLLKCFNLNELFISLRASRSYNEAKPRFIDDDKILRWKWTEMLKYEWNTWGYPFSLDGNIYRFRILNKIINRIDFKAPNSLEAALNDNVNLYMKLLKNKESCPLESVIFNNPLNKVQIEGETWNANIDLEYLNDKYLEGYLIDNSVLYNTFPNKTHFFVEPRLVKGKFTKLSN